VIMAKGEFRKSNENVNLCNNWNLPIKILGECES
jgi:hypothetical protein